MERLEKVNSLYLRNIKEINELKKSDLKCNIFSVYEFNAMTIQELLCSFYTKINEVIEQSNATIDLCEWLVNEGLSIEVSSKLDEWLNDGTFEKLINETIFNNLNNKVDDLSKKHDTDISEINEKINGIPVEINIVEHPSITENSDCTVIKLSNGKFIMIDCGDVASFNYYKSKFDSYGLDKLEYLFLTHFHSDHVGQVADVLTTYSPKAMYIKTPIWSKMPDIEDTWKTREYYDIAVNKARELGIPIIEFTDTTLQLTEYDKLTFYCSNYHSDYTYYNNISMMMLFEHKNFKMFFAGDSTITTEEYFLNTYQTPTNIDVLKVGHHGWEGSSSYQFIKKLKPKHSLFGNINYMLWVQNGMGEVPQRLLWWGSKVYDMKNINKGCTIGVFNGTFTISLIPYSEFKEMWYVDEDTKKECFIHKDGRIARDEIIFYDFKYYKIGDDWFLIKDTWWDNHYSSTSGQMQRNKWHRTNVNNWYYFDDRCEIIKGTWKFIEGLYYQFNDNGVCLDPNGQSERPSDM